MRRKSGRYTARYDIGKKRTILAGSFATAKEAAEARAKFIKALNSGKDVLRMLKRPVRFDSATGVRGITKRPDGYMVRVTNKKGKRIYVGWWSEFEIAKKELQKWQAAQN